jgi:hypothetical protein
MKWPHLILLICLAAFSFAGSFECHAHSGDDHHSASNSTHNVPDPEP